MADIWNTVTHGVETGVNDAVGGVETGVGDVRGGVQTVYGGVLEVVSIAVIHAMAEAYSFRQVNVGMTKVQDGITYVWSKLLFIAFYGVRPNTGHLY